MIFLKWLVRKLREEYGIYPISELQTWGHCGCCGSPIKDGVFPKEWAWGLCKRCKEETDGKEKIEFLREEVADIIRASYITPLIKADQIQKVYEKYTYLKAERELPGCTRFLKQQDNYPLSPTSYFDKLEMEKLCPMLTPDSEGRVFKAVIEW